MTLDGGAWQPPCLRFSKLRFWQCEFGEPLVWKSPRWVALHVLQDRSFDYPDGEVGGCVDVSPARKPDLSRKDGGKGDGTRPGSDNMYVSQTTCTSLFRANRDGRSERASRFPDKPSLVAC